MLIPWSYSFFSHTHCSHIFFYSLIKYPCHSVEGPLFSFHIVCLSVHNSFTTIRYRYGEKRRLLYMGMKRIDGCYI